MYSADNTAGYTQEQLDALNRDLAEYVAKYSAMTSAPVHEIEKVHADLVSKGRDMRIFNAAGVPTDNIA